LTPEELLDITSTLARKPGHEAVRANIYQLLSSGLGISRDDISLEQGLTSIRGRTDALVERTVFEFKSDLVRERREAEDRLRDYLMARNVETKQSTVGIVTDGSVFETYVIRDSKLIQLTRFSTNRDSGASLLQWLSNSVLLGEELSPSPEVVQRILGRESLSYQVARNCLEMMWDSVKLDPRAQTVRELWAARLQRVYGMNVDADDLFFQHTYLTVVAKSMAALIMGFGLPSPSDVLSGRQFRDSKIKGAVESDFFDWLLLRPDGERLVSRIGSDVARFRLEAVQQDVLKGLYESLIDPTQRRLLGEYYTPDWLAQRICEAAVLEPLSQRVLDPACGSGTFLFCAVRRFLAAAEAAGMQNSIAVERCTQMVIGVDIHPVAAIIARVTYLLAIGSERLMDRGTLNIPVYLGDSLQWGTFDFVGAQEVRVTTAAGTELLFPFGITDDLALFDDVVDGMEELAQLEATTQSLRQWLESRHLSETDVDALAATFEEIKRLQNLGANSIYGYVARNQARPMWLSKHDHRADVLVGNPPWLAFRYMQDNEMQQRFRVECQRLQIWVGRNLANLQDLSAYFMARCAELYLRNGGIVAFAMPYAALSGPHFALFRTGQYHSTGRTRHNPGQSFLSLRFYEAWSFDHSVQPLFPVPSCVLIARREAAGALPEYITAYEGTLPRRNATNEEAIACLRHGRQPWPPHDEEMVSPYGSRFRNGATMYPRVLCVVERVEMPNRVGSNAAIPLVRSRRSNLEKEPWRNVEPLQFPVDVIFLRKLYVGASLASFRLLKPLECVVPFVTNHGLVDSEQAQARGYLDLARFLRQAESTWVNHSGGDMGFLERLNYQNNLVAQLPAHGPRVIYARSGTNLAAALLEDAEAIVESSLYWMTAESKNEAYYLLSVLNSEATRAAIESRQSQGQWGPRDVAKQIFRLPIPLFSPTDTLHQELSQAGLRAEHIAATVALPDELYFVTARDRVRDALREDGVLADVDAMVNRLMGLGGL
jgi:SAM-dependent methyltransferase